MPVCVQVEWKCFQVCLKSTTEVIANLSHPCALCVAEEEWERPERQSWPPELRMPPFGISLLHLCQSSLNLFRGLLGFCSWRIVSLVICVLLGISKWWKSTQKEYNDVEWKGMWLEQPSLWSPWNPTLVLQLTGLSRHSSYSEKLYSEWLSHWLSETCIASNRILFAEIKSDGGEHFPAGWETPQARLSDLMCYKWTVKSSLMHVVGHRAHQPHPFTSYCQKDLDCQSTRLFGWAGCLSSLVQSDRIVTASCHLSLI